MKKSWWKNFLITIFKPESGWSRWLLALIILAYFLAAFVGLLDPVKEVIDRDPYSLKIGSYNVTAYKFIHGVITLMGLLWIASLISVTGEKAIQGLDKIKSSNRALLVKGLKIVVYVIVFFMSLNILGIDLTAFAVLSGAIGIGIGFGLQKITSNFISGLILLFEKSVEEGDLVELSGGYQGIVKSTGARYTLIETFDSKEIMIPNEDFITNRVTNWTFTNEKGRVEILLGVSYESDIERARELILEAAIEHPRCSKDPEPQCYLTAFGSSSVDFVLYFWVDNVTEGRLEPKSDVFRAIWRKFNDNGIVIPYPQSDIHIKNPEVFK
ncbi:MAG: mechanosensitive ion channel [Acidimicrobiales bacterium]|nr:mechanosensitive ion channel [Hyphomonadaceae bacterium]RZV37049.1 MAG: mechanosensitive ion channel [Acidimicrobiales bacterium]